ncbi:putative membrane protein, partial [Vibrio parahaemolyticus Peru-288]
LFIFH